MNRQRILKWKFRPPADTKANSRCSRAPGCARSAASSSAARSSSSTTAFRRASISTRSARWARSPATTATACTATRSTCPGCRTSPRTSISARWRAPRPTAGWTCSATPTRRSSSSTAASPTCSREENPADAKRYLPAAAAAQKLLSPSEMGELFKVLAVGKGVTDSLIGFMPRGPQWHALAFSSCCFFFQPRAKADKPLAGQPPRADARAHHPAGLRAGDAAGARAREGARLTLRYCVQCHNLANPAMHDAARWPSVVAAHGAAHGGQGKHGQADGRNDGRRGSAGARGDEQAIIAYLRKHAQRAARPEEDIPRSTRPPASRSGSPAASATCCPIRAATPPPSGRPWSRAWRRTWNG